MSNQGRDSQTDEVLWISRREVALQARRRGLPWNPSRTLPTLKRVALSPTGGPWSGILDKRFGQKADMAPPNLLFLAGPAAASFELLKSCLRMTTASFPYLSSLSLTSYEPYTAHR